ncbi:hypothetical protein DYU11_03960 [Fibrisoma montanum]|uniref:Uncharacterized protein n=1 Tax=Fibrisoma montanum TaxID=2305895 RepID=A0A418MJG3_9BACT|nr:hypothetical protein [Fibrisoma montanum]RIV27471.1 hypothetical protein DYU11_03960 [Fibrisoma montanum]
MSVGVVSSHEPAQPDVISQWASGLKNSLGQNRNRTVAALQFSTGLLEICLDTTSFWIIYSFPTGGKVAIRACYDPQALYDYTSQEDGDRALGFRINGALGQFHVRLELLDNDRPFLRYTTSLRPASAFTVQSFPRDVYLLDKTYDPLKTEGVVHITQNGPTSGLAYVSCLKPKGPTLFYFQNLTALNDFFEQTRTEPSSVVGAKWPELGLSLPSSDTPLAKHRDVVISDAFLTLRADTPKDDYQTADWFIDEFARVYRLLDKPATAYYDWPQAADKTIRSLSRSSACYQRINNRFYLNAYVGSSEKPPESMVQLCVLVPMLAYQAWKGRPSKLAEQLRQNVPSFYRDDLKTVVRWLPGRPFRKSDLSEEEDHNKMDSWYLFHILMNLGRLALQGDETAREIFLKSLDFAIEAAHRFKYEWPVFYHVKTLEILKSETKPGEKGEQDVPGVYTYVMMQAFELTNDDRYLREAELSAGKLVGSGFNLLYQTNITIMSAVALVKLWKTTGNRLYFDLSRLCIANTIAKMWVWNGTFGFGKNYNTFMGVSCLKDASYIAAYEEGESFATALDYLRLLGSDASPSLSLMLAEYMKYLINRGRYYYPYELPGEAVADQSKEGQIRRQLTIPLEDLRTGWQQAGQVGQEVYGSASAFVAAAYAYQRHERMPLTIFVEYPVIESGFRDSRPDTGEYFMHLAGVPELACRLRIFPNHGSLPNVRVFTDSETPHEILQKNRTQTYIDYEVVGGTRYRIEWQTGRRKRSTKKS